MPAAGPSSLSFLKANKPQSQWFNVWGSCARENARAWAFPGWCWSCPWGCFTRRGQRCSQVTRSRCSKPPGCRIVSAKQHNRSPRAAPPACATCLALPLSSRAARRSHENSLQEESCFHGKSHNSSNGRKGERLSSDRVRSALHSTTWEKNPPRLSDATWMWGAQHLKGRAVYSLSVFLLFCLTKAVFLVSSLLPGLSYWNPARALHRPSPLILTCTPTQAPVVTK